MSRHCEPQSGAAISARLLRRKAPRNDVNILYLLSKSISQTLRFHVKFALLKICKPLKTSKYGVFRVFLYLKQRI